MEILLYVDGCIQEMVRAAQAAQSRRRVRPVVDTMRPARAFAGAGR
jgi:hypothetical protein